ncbi:hypothetical protein [Lactobacillus taiwanensis]|uniref:hypothetical protein n=1 Tax=Lactobacillus taiwanensis TaxID=508451 RepID=UPI00117A6306
MACVEKLILFNSLIWSSVNLLVSTPDSSTISLIWPFNSALLEELLSASFTEASLSSLALFVVLAALFCFTESFFSV